MNRRSFIGFPLDDLSKAEIRDTIAEFVRSGKPHAVVILNANKIYLADKHPALRAALDRAALILPENAVYLGMKWLGSPLKAKNTGGVDTTFDLMRDAKNSGHRFYLLGAEEDTVRRAAERCRDLFGAQIVGWRNGYFRPEETPQIIAETRAARPDILFVALGSPKQELWIAEHLDALGVPVCLGVGGTFKALAGEEKPPPAWMRSGLEWLWRAFQDPKKFKRYLIVNSYFMVRFVRHRLWKR